MQNSGGNWTVRGRGRGSRSMPNAQLLGSMQDQQVSQITYGNSIAEESMTWLSSLDHNSKCQYLREVLTFFDCGDGLTSAFRLVVNAKKRQERKRKPWKVPTEEESSKKKKKDLLVLQSAGSDPTVLQPSKPESPVFKNYTPSQIVSFDTEFVDLVKRDKYGKIVKACGTVAVVDFHGNTLYKGTVYHPPGTFAWNSKTEKINGFNDTYFEKEKAKCANEEEFKQLEFKTVRNNVMMHLEDKLIVVCGGGDDFRCLELNLGDYLSGSPGHNGDVFDLQSFFRKWSIKNEDGTYTKRGEPNFHAIGLKSLVHHYYTDKTFQNGTHSCLTDAERTMQLFREKYLTLKDTVGDFLNDFVHYEKPNDPFGDIVIVK